MAKPKNPKATISSFISLASHKLRTPLTAIIWYSELLLREDVGKLNKEQKEFMRDISSGSERMEHLINDLLAISRIERKKINAGMIEEKDIVNLIKEVIKKKQIVAEDKKIKVKFTKKFPKSIKLKVDPEKFAHTIRIVLDNAIQYGSEKSTILFDQKSDKKHLTLSIENQGIGVPTADLKKIFKKGYRSPNIIPEHPDGHGFGLFIAKKFTELQKGKIWCESKEGSKTTIFIQLPL